MSYLLMVSPDVVDIGSEHFVVYLSCVYIYIYVIYVRLVMPSYLLFGCIYFNGVSHAVQNEKKLWKFTQSDM